MTGGESRRRDRLEGRGRTLLMFAYYFPPCTCWPTASERSLGFATGLSELGWRPVIVTREVVDAGCACGPFPTPTGSSTEDSPKRMFVRCRFGTASREQDSIIGRGSATSSDGSGKISRSFWTSRTMTGSLVRSTPERRSSPSGRWPRSGRQPVRTPAFASVSISSAGSGSPGSRTCGTDSCAIASVPVAGSHSGAASGSEGRSQPFADSTSRTPGSTWRTGRLHRTKDSSAQKLTSYRAGSIHEAGDCCAWKLDT